MCHSGLGTTNYPTEKEAMQTIERLAVCKVIDSAHLSVTSDKQDSPEKGGFLVVLGRGAYANSGHRTRWEQCSGYDAE